MSEFRHYARYYDMLYREKRYAEEAEFVSAQLAPPKGSARRLLELGCGTGAHAAEFARLGWAVRGYDLSPGMVEAAEKRRSALGPALAAKMSFGVGDVRSVMDGGTYDGVASLFHVMSYQVSNRDLDASFATAFRHLAIGGRFFFDFWYGPAVLRDPPAVRVKRLEDPVIHVTRIAEPEVDYQTNTVAVNYEVIVREKASNQLVSCVETHTMRYWFLPELADALARGGFSIVRSGSGCADSPLTCDSWFGWILAERTHS